MNGLTPQQIGWCHSESFLREIRKVLQWSHCDQSLEMAVLVSLFAQLAGMQNLTCQQLEALAAQYNCLPRQAQLPALIYLAAQMTGTAPDYINYPGPPTENPPALQNIVVDVNGVQWQFFNNQWN